MTTLSPLYLHEVWYLPDAVAKKLSEYFNTMESVEAATRDEFRYKALAAGVNPNFVNPIREGITKKLKELGVIGEGAKHDEQPPESGQ